MKISYKEFQVYKEEKQTEILGYKLITMFLAVIVMVLGITNLFLINAI